MAFVLNCHWQQEEKKHKCKYLSAPLKMLHCLDEMKNIKEI